MVDDQQEQIDNIADNAGYSRAATQAGAEHIHQYAEGLCGPLNVMDERSTTVAQEETARTLRVGEDFEWTMPFETIRDDMRAVQQDVLQFGKILVNELQTNVVNTASRGLAQCSAFESAGSCSTHEEHEAL